LQARCKRASAFSIGSINPSRILDRSGGRDNWLRAAATLSARDHPSVTCHAQWPLPIPCGDRIQREGARFSSVCLAQHQPASSDVDTSGPALARKARRLWRCSRPRRIGMTYPKLTIRRFPPIDWALACKMTPFKKVSTTSPKWELRWPDCCAGGLVN
jgi:hypothetical protein